MVVNNFNKLIRVMQRLDEFKRDTLRLKEVRKAVMLEIGTDDRTINKTLKKLSELDWLKRQTRYNFGLIRSAEWQRRI